MNLKGVVMEDFLQYKKPCMTLQFPVCSFKCDKEAGESVCQNSELTSAPCKSYSVRSICEQYLKNDISKSICCQGLEPMDSWGELFYLIRVLRLNYRCYDDVVIYTGYYPEEIQPQISQLKPLKNIIIKFGRFIPNRPHRYDEILGVELASDNQYGVVIC